MILTSLKSRIILSITGIVVLSLAITTFLIVDRVKFELSGAIEGNALNLLEAKKIHVESQYNSILYHKSVMLARRKMELKNNTTIASALITSAYQEYKNGKISEDNAKLRAITDLQQLRYDNGIGYFWINDTVRPYPRMVMHPTMPELDGKILDAPEFNCALGRNENLFKAFVDVCLEKDEGYVDYLWPKPTPIGLTEQQPKISYVILFKPWNWIIGTGVYIDDIEKDVQDRIDAVIEDLNKTIVKQTIAGSGYFFIFNKNNYMLVHPNLASTDGNTLINPVTGNIILDEFKKALSSSDSSMDYLWDKPGYKGEYRFPKKAYITYYEPLGWYICSSVYLEDFEQKISSLANTIILFSGSFFIIAVFISLLVSKSITNPLNMLVRSIGKTDDDGIPIDAIPVTGTTEIEALGATINSMIDSVSESRKELKAQRDFSLGIIIGAPYIILVLNPDGIATFINPAGEKATGYSKEEIIGKNWREQFFPGEDYYQTERLLEFITEGEIAEFEITLTCKNGERKAVVLNSLTKRDNNNNTLEVIVFGNDVTERKHHEAELRRLRNYLTNIIDSMPSLLIGVDIEGRVTQWNKTAEQTTGIAADFAHGKTLSDVFPQMASEMEKIVESIRTRETRHEQKKTRMSENGASYEDITVYPLIANGVEGAVIRVDDVTEQVRIEEMMVQSEKMMSVGGLAAGMAHEINNPLAGMMQTASVISDRLTNTDLPANHRAAEEAGTTMEAIGAFMDARGVPRMLERIRESGSRAAEIVSNMLSFARKSDSSFSTRNMAEVLDQSVNLAGSDYDLKKKHDFRRIEIVREYEDGLPFVPCEGAKIQQVLLNILRNGAEAMQEEAEKDDSRKPRFILRLMHEKDAGRVRIEIEDNGPGMDESIRKRIFEPFFTTKPTDQGTGLGLSVSYFIITENHGGEMSVESTTGEGTIFSISLPVKRRES